MAPSDQSVLRRSRWQAAIVLPPAAVTLLLAICTPIYTDEIGWHMIKARLFVDYFATMTVMAPSCTVEGTAGWPWYMIPFRAFDSLFYLGMEGPWRIRAVGVAALLGWIVLAFWSLRRFFAGTVPAWQLVAWMGAFLSVGLLPFLLIMNRPEQGMLLLTTVFLFLPLLLPRQPARRGRTVLLVGGIVVLAAALFAAHPKGVFFVPLVAVVAWLVLPGWVSRGLTVAATVGLAAASGLHWNSHLVCPEDEALRQMIEGRSLSLAAGEGIHAFVKQFLVSASTGFDTVAYVRGIVFRPSYMSNWLPPAGRLSIADRVVNGLVVALFAGLVIAFAVLLGGLVKQSWANRRLSPALAVIVGMLASCAMMAVIQSFKLPYEATLVLPLFGLMLLLALGASGRRAVLRAAGAPTWVLIAVALVSQAHLWHTFGGEALGDWRDGGYLDAQQFSISPFGYGDARQSILAAAERCGIDARQPQQKIVVDELAYFAFFGSFRPMLGTYVTGEYAHGIPDLEAFLRNRGSGGLVARCDILPPAVLAVSKRSGDVCCLSLS